MKKVFGKNRKLLCIFEVCFLVEGIPIHTLSVLVI